RKVFFMCEMNYEEIENQIGYTFKNKELLKQAFTRRSYSQEHGGENNEVLEVYGDMVLECIVGNILSEHFGKFEKYENALNQRPFNIDLLHSNKTMGEYSSDYDEGQLTEFRKMLVSRQTLAQRIYDLDLEPYLQLGKGDEKNGVRDKDSVKEDLFEAILGAVAIDSSWDIQKMQDTVEVMLCPGQLLFDENHVGDLTQWTIDEYGCVPKTCFDRYRHPYLLLSAPSGYFNAFCDCYLTLGEYRYSFHATGKSQAEARDNVFRFAYQHLKEKGLLHSIKDEIEEPSESMAINQLETLSRRGYFDLPKYKYTESHDKNGNPEWTVKCSINGVDEEFSSKSNSKKAAKKKAAFKMLNYILENYDEEE
ncbi:MAG: hypothetical protein IJH36_13910, partial [Clostridia bacterium]|nr:hypothetical protein [Clostridia bacterium]